MQSTGRNLVDMRSLFGMPKRRLSGTIMWDDLKPPGVSRRTAPAARLLARIAETLGVPVASFYGADDRVPSCEGGLDPSGEAALAVVRSYLREITPEARLRFVRAIVALVQAEGEERSLENEPPRA